MTIRLRTIFFIGLGILSLWFLSVEYAILTPFVLAAIFAYICNPIVNLFSNQLKLPRMMSVVIVYLILFAVLGFIGTLLTQRIIDESVEIRNYISYLLNATKTQITTLPDWFKPTIYDLLFSLRKTTTISGSFSFVPFFPKALSELTNFVIFIFSGIYFLKDGGNFVHKFIAHVPNDIKIDIEILIRKINRVLGGYLRGQIFLVILMAVWTFLALTILGIRFSLIIAIFSGFAEIIPVIGPIVAGAVACMVAFITGTNNFGLTPINSVLAVIAIYFILRHLEDYFVTPQIMGKITKLPPFIVFFSVIAGGHLMGILGLILAVPIAAVIRILLEFSLDYMNRNSTFTMEANKPDSVSSRKKRN